MNDDLQKLILAQLEEITKIVRDVDSRLTKLETASGIHNQASEKRSIDIENDLAQIDRRLNELEKFRVKLFMGAATVAFLATMFWEVAGPMILSFWA